MRAACVAVVVALLHAPGVAGAQSLAQIGRATVIDSAPIYVVPDATRVPLRVAARGSALSLLKEEDGWCQVQFQDPDLGLRTGWVQSRFVQVQLDSLRPRDLSVPSATAAPARPPAPAQRPAPAPAPVQTPVQAPAPTSGQAPIPADYVPEPSVARRVPNSVFLDGNFMSFHPQQKAVSLAGSQPLFGEIASSTVTYPALPAVQRLAASVTVAMGHNLGFGFRVLLPRYSEFATLTARVPHPTIVNRFGSDAGTSGELERKDLLLDLSATYIVNQRHWRAVLSGGPSYFHTSLDLVNRVLYTQNTTILGTNVITVTGASTANRSAGAWGLNLGGDVAAFPWQHVGVGGGLLFNKGTIHVDNPYSLTSTSPDFDLDMSSVTLLVGPRFRF